MSLTAAAIRLMAERGMTAQDIADIAEAMEKPLAEMIPDLDALDRKRARDAERMRRKREGERQSRDIEATVASDVAEPPTCERAQVVFTTSSSLRSEEALPPETPTVSTPRGGDKRGSRLPENWIPDFEAALAVGLGREDAQVEGDQFRDYWRAVPGAKGRKLDWPATWRRWCRTAAENRSTRKAHVAKPHHRHPASTRAEGRAVWSDIFAESHAEGAGGVAGSESGFG